MKLRQVVVCLADLHHCSRCTNFQIRNWHARPENFAGTRSFYHGKAITLLLWLLLSSYITLFFPPLLLLLFITLTSEFILWISIFLISCPENGGSSITIAQPTMLPNRDLKWRNGVEKEDNLTHSRRSTVFLSLVGELRPPVATDGYFKVYHNHWTWFWGRIKALNSSVEQEPLRECKNKRTKENVGFVHSSADEKVWR